MIYGDQNYRLLLLEAEIKIQCEDKHYVEGDEIKFQSRAMVSSLLSNNIGQRKNLIGFHEYLHRIDSNEKPNLS